MPLSVTNVIPLLVVGKTGVNGIGLASHGIAFPTKVLIHMTRLRMLYSAPLEL